MHGLPRLSAAQAAVSDYTALAKSRLTELKVTSSSQRPWNIHHISYRQCVYYYRTFQIHLAPRMLM
jgi:ABC-type siderophore export system fused ATPase/permease subunit